MSRALNRLSIAFVFAIIAFIAANAAYYQYCEKMAVIALNEAIENHSEIDEEEIIIAQFDEIYWEHQQKVQNQLIK